MKGHAFMRAFYGLVVSSVLAVIGVLVFRDPKEEHPHLVASSEADAMREFKGSEPKAPGASVRLTLHVVEDEAEDSALGDELEFHIHMDDQRRLGADPGDLVVVSAPGWWHGGLKSVHGRIAVREGIKPGHIEFPRELLAYAGFKHIDEVIITLEG
jgi:hypothetical protein